MGIKGTGDLSLIREVNASLINAPGVKLDINKLIDPAAKGFNKVFNTLFGKKYVEQMRHIALSAAQTNLDIRRIEQGLASYDHEDQSLVEHPENIKSLIATAIQDEEIANILRCAIFAADYIVEDGASDPSQDFINRWKNEAKQINSDDMQIIWARILAAEINSPETISLRTLDIIKNITPFEAQTFMDLVKYICWGKLVISEDYNDAEANKKQYKLISDLNESGLIRNESFYQTTGMEWPQEQFFINGDFINCYYLSAMEALYIIPIQYCPHPPRSTGSILSTAGSELFKIIDKAIYSSDRFPLEILDKMIPLLCNQAFYPGITVHMYYSTNNGDSFKEKSIVVPQ